MVKKKAKKKAAKVLTDQQRQAMADALTRKIAAMFREHLVKTGRIVAEVQVVNNIVQEANGKQSISQTVNMKFGILAPAEKQGPLTEGICLKSSP